MSKPISHLVWLGAGNAAEPANLFDKAEKITLIEARESACLQLQQKYNEPHFQIKQHIHTLCFINFLVSYRINHFFGDYKSLIKDVAFSKE